MLDCSATFLSWSTGIYVLSEDNSTFAANPDVAGTGVIIGFLATGYVCWIMLVFHYLLVYKPEDSFSASVNPVDQGLLSWVRKRLKPSPRWEGCLEKCIHLLSDQQIATGIAILASAYLQIDVFHVCDWQISIWLAWFCSMSHLGTLSVLQHHLQVHPALRVLRLMLMLVIAIASIVALLPTGSPAWLLFPGQPAGCYMHFLTGSWKAFPRNVTGNAQFLAMSTVVILLVAYATQIIKMFKRSSASARYLLRTKPGNLLKRGLHTLLNATQEMGPKWSSWAILFLYMPCLAVFFTARVVCDYFQSIFCEIIWLLCTLFWATVRLFAYRKQVELIYPRSNVVTVWNFGQLIPVLLLIVPLLSITQICYESWKNHIIPSAKPSLGHIYAEPSSTNIPHSLPFSNFDFPEAQNTSEARNSADSSSAIEPHPPSLTATTYQDSWIPSMVLLLITSTASLGAFLILWAASTEMVLFLDHALPSLALLVGMFYTPLIFFAFLFLQPPGSFSVVQRVLRRVWPAIGGGGGEVEERAVRLLALGLWISHTIAIAMVFVFM